MLQRNMKKVLLDDMQPKQIDARLQGQAWGTARHPPDPHWVLFFG